MNGIRNREGRVEKFHPIKGSCEKFEYRDDVLNEGAFDSVPYELSSLKHGLYNTSTL